jgi:hypothetical protein
MDMKKFLSVLLAFVLVFSLSTSIFAAEKKVKECQPTGDGTQKKPFVICTPDQLLKAVGDSQAQYYKLGADIDLNAYKKLENTWSPAADFGGILNGKGHKILNLTTSLGLLKSIKENAKVENLTLDNVLAGGDTYSAMLANSNFGSIENVTASGTTGSRYGTGGLVIYNFGKISNCYTEGSVSAKSGSAGGLVLKNSGTIINSSSNSTVFGSYTGGGLVDTNEGTIQNSYATGSVVSEGFWGGLGGKSGGLVSSNLPKGIIKKSYASGNVYTKNMQSSNFVYVNPKVDHLANRKVDHPGDKNGHPRVPVFEANARLVVAH